MEEPKLLRKIPTELSRLKDRLLRRRQAVAEDTATTQAGVWEHTSALIDEIRSKTEPYPVRIRDIDILVHPGVFPPTTETRLIADYIHVSPDERVLDLTTGSGVDAVITGLQGASGIAIDINPAAVSNANANFQRFGVDMLAIQSDMFENVPPQQFDLVLCNPPYYDGEANDPLGYALFGGRAYLTKMFDGLRNYMSPTGRALITYAEWAGDVDFFEKMATKNGYTFSVIGKRASDDGKRIYRLYEICHKDYSGQARYRFLL